MKYKQIIHTLSNFIKSLVKYEGFMVFYIISFTFGAILFIAYLAYLVGRSSDEDICEDLSKDYYNATDRVEEPYDDPYIVRNGNCYIKIVKPISRDYRTYYVLDKWITQEQAERDIEKALSK